MFFIASTVLGQPCDSLLIVSRDKFTDAEEVAMSRPIVKTQGESETLTLRVSPTKNKSLVFEASVVSSSFGCTDEKGMVYFVFDNNEKFSLHNQAKINCKGLSLVYLTGGLGNKALLYLLTKRRIAAIRITSREESFEADLDEREGLELQKVLNCMLKR